MKTIYSRLLMLMVPFVVTLSVFSTRGSMQAPETYPLVCRGSSGATIWFKPERRLVLKFKRGTAPAGSGLAPGECSWIDRGMYEAEPDVLVQQVREGGGDDPQYKWTTDLNEPNSYWTFDVYNDRAGQMIVTASRKGGGPDSGLQATPGSARLETLPKESSRQTSESAATDQNKPAGESEAEVKGSPTFSGLVTWDYYHMNHPEVLKEILREVREGKLPPDVVQGISITPASGRFNTADPRSNGTSSVNSANKSIAKGVPGSEVLARVLGDDVASQPVLNTVPAIPASEIEHTPEALKLGSVYDGGKLERSLLLISPADGNVQAKISPGTPFRIVKLVAYDGTVDESSAVETSEVDMADRTGPEAIANSGVEKSIIERSDTSERPDTSPSRKTVRRDMATTFRKLGVSASRDSAPFVLPAKAGQKLRVVVAFEPSLENRNWAGNYSTDVVVSGSRWRLNVPAQATFKGLNVGPWILLSESELDLIVYTTPHLVSLNVPIKMVNGGKAEACTITAEELPRGVTMKPLELSLPQNSTRDATLTFVINTDSTSTDRAEIATGQNMVVRLDWEGGTKRSYLALNLFPYFYNWDWYGKVGGCDVSYFMRVFPDGDFQFSCYINNENVVYRRDFFFRFYVDGEQLVNLADNVGRRDTKIRVYASEKWLHPRPLFERHPGETRSLDQSVVSPVVPRQARSAPEKTKLALLLVHDYSEGVET